MLLHSRNAVGDLQSSRVESGQQVGHMWLNYLLFSDVAGELCASAYFDDMFTHVARYCFFVCVKQIRATEADDVVIWKR